MPLHEFFTSFFSVFYRTIRTAFSSSVMLAKGSLSNPNATIAILLRLKKTAIHHRVVGTIGGEQHSKAGIRLRYFKQIGDHHLPSSSHQKATTYWGQQDTFGAESREGFYWMHWNRESSKWRLLKVRTLPWTSNPTLRKVDVCPASNVSLQKQFREACGLGEECSVRPVRKQQWQRLWWIIPPPISSLQITAQKFYLP